MFDLGFPRGWSTLKKLLWLKITQAAAVVWATVTGSAPLTLSGAAAREIKSLTQTGLCIQDGTPAPDAPVDIVCNNGTLKWDSVNERIYCDGTPGTLTITADGAETRAVLRI